VCLLLNVYTRSQTLSVARQSRLRLDLLRRGDFSRGAFAESLVVERHYCVHDDPTLNLDVAEVEFPLVAKNGNLSGHTGKDAGNRSAGHQLDRSE